MTDTPHEWRNTMATSKAKTVEAYLEELSPERRETVEAVRDVIRKNLPDGYAEGMEYGMIGYYVPLERYPKTYNKQPLGLAALVDDRLDPGPAQEHRHHWAGDAAADDQAALRGFRAFHHGRTISFVL